MLVRTQENLPGGSLKYLLVYFKIRIFKCILIYIHIHISIHISIHICIFTYIHMYIYIYTYVYIWVMYGFYNLVGVYKVFSPS